MKIELLYKPSYSVAKVNLSQGESIQAESGALMSMSPNISIETHKAQRGGLLKSLKAAFLGGESFWMNTFTADQAGEVLLAPTLPGDLEKLELNGTVFVQSSSYLASEPKIDIDTKFQGLKGFFSGESLFFLKLSGSGTVLISSYGGIETLDVEDEFIVDTGHIVAFQEGLNYEITKFGGWKSFFLGGEGFVAKFKGKGKLWIQSRNVPSLGSWFREELPPKQR
ncbi:TIGR00266 family protein [Leptospira wolffii]|uniref:TIGR00266 family protein n=1 Tax=Leptospira wolffii TaxID=409998 RepID=A0A2M9ZDG3_9LEPT|nr:TIGR00266 family protein [Leptospira wolffii]PJZ66449.1 TIGR00266 family protein [Leptospira wolffii]TGK59984.1 TIGR00266 family protein [Leptospira wolffii]TGK70026.1 TIGR00266 family protein [Leptospira wolffii]TGK75992.1 TIGR00266 family protein [Leptospira wolffii]TGL30243.1 TIGR00266 family protein [Leptospira wolffii]